MKKLVYGLFLAGLVLCSSCSNVYYLLTGDGFYRYDRANGVQEVGLSVSVLRKVLDKFSTDSVIVNGHDIIMTDSVNR